MRGLASAWIVLAVAGSAAGTQRQEVVPLGAPSARAAEGFTSIFDVAELPDGRVLLTDNREPALALVDFDGGTVERMGRVGQGPREFMGVFSVLENGDTYRIFDTRNRRFIVVSAQGEILGTEPFTRPPFSGIAPPRGPDPDGRVYFTLRTVSPRGLDRTATLYRWDPATGDADSVATVMQYAPGQGGRGIVPMPVADAWSILPDGSVLVLRAREYRAECSGGPAGPTMGEPVEHPRVRADGAQRDRWIEGMLTRGGGSASVRSSSSEPDQRDGQMRRYRSELDPDRFPDFVPPFTGGYKPAAPWGEVWLRLETASDSERTVFDVIGRRGELVRRVSVDGVAQVVGFGTDAVYIQRTDAFDLQWLERYPRPR